MSDLKYRFSEIMSAVSMLPSVDMGAEDMEKVESDVETATEWLLPNLTQGLNESRLRDAIMCQALREDIEFRFKLTAILTNSAKKSIQDKMERHEEPSDEDMYALAVSAHILWSSNQFTSLCGALGMIGQICATFDFRLPEYVTALFRNNGGVDRFAKNDPLALISGETDSE